METMSGRKSFLVCQSILLVMACGVQTVMLSERQLLKLGIMQTAFHGLGFLCVLTLIFCATVLYRLLKRRNWVMVAILLQALGAFWGFTHYYLFLNAVLSPSVLGPRGLWQYYISLAVALVYLLIYHFIQKKRQMPAIQETPEEIQ